MESSRPCGYPHEIFIEQPPAFCVCSICLEILRNPRQCPNGHVYCYDCIFQCMDHKKECPSCKCYLPEEVLANSLFARNMIGEMQVKCPTTVKESCVKSDLHCTWVGSINDLDDHLNHSCASSIVPCPNVECAVVVPRGNLANHIASCVYSTLICPLCQGPHLRGETSSHAEKCARYTVPCRNACGAIIARIDMESHISTCPDEMVECSYRSVGCSSDCPGRLLRKDVIDHHSQPAVLAVVVNSLLTKRVEDVAEMQCLRAALARRDESISALEQQAKESGGSIARLKSRWQVVFTEIS